MKKLGIIKVTDEKIIFNDYSYISFSHEQDCCEWNFADFEQLDDIARASVFTLPLKFAKCDGGFRFGDKSKMFFVPCYSEQNGYYTTDIDIYYSTPVTRDDGNIETWVTKLMVSTLCEYADECD